MVAAFLLRAKVWRTSAATNSRCVPYVCAIGRLPGSARDQWSVNWLNDLGRQGMTRRMVIVTLTKSVYFHSALIAPYLAL